MHRIAAALVLVPVLLWYAAALAFLIPPGGGTYSPPVPVITGVASPPVTVPITITSGGTFPLAVSNGTLQTAGGSPFMLIGDSPQGVTGALNPIPPCSASTPTLANCTGSADVLPSAATWVAYVKDRAAQGTNTIMMYTICETTFCNANGSSYDGLLPFGSQLRAAPGGAHYIGPNTTGTPSTTTCPEGSPPADDQCWDMATAGQGTSSAAYWTRVDEYIALAGQYGIQIMLSALANSSEGGVCPSNTTSLQALIANNYIATGNTSKIVAFGQFLADRYKNTPNLIWYIGNDVHCWNQSFTGAASGSVAYDTLQYALATAIHNREVQDGAIVHVFTSEVDGGMTSLDDNQNNWASVLNISGEYQTFPQAGPTIPYDISLHAWAQRKQTTTILPINVESSYQGQDWDGTNSSISGCSGSSIGPPASSMSNPSACALRQRHEYYWTILSGGVLGFMEGNNYSVGWQPGWNTNGGGNCLGGGTPSACIDTPATTQLGYMGKFFMNYPSWQTLIPDVSQGGTAIARPFVTAGRGTYSTSADWSSNNWVASGATSDGLLAFAYFPGTNGSGAVSGSISATVNYAKVIPGSTGVQAYWYDPTQDPGTGPPGAAYTLICNPCTTSAPQTVTTPAGTHSDAYADWVLVASPSGR